VQVGGEGYFGPLKETISKKTPSGVGLSLPRKDGREKRGNMKGKKESFCASKKEGLP